MSKTKVIAFANNKGGSGKTTTCSNVGCAMALAGKKVLMLDGDMQLNLTISFFDEEKAYEYAKGEKNIYRAMVGEKDLSDYIVETLSTATKLGTVNNCYYNEAAAAGSGEGTAISLEKLNSKEFLDSFCADFVPGATHPVFKK